MLDFLGSNWRSAISFLSRPLSATLAYALTLVLARTMTSVEYGKYAIGFSLASIIGLSIGVGQNTSILRLWPAYTSRNDTASALRALRTATRLTVLAACGGAVAYAIAIFALHGLRVISIAVLPLLAAAPLITAMSFSEFWAAALRARGSIVAALFPRDVAWRILMLAVCACFGALGSRLSGASALMLSALSLFVLVAWQIHYMHKYLPVASQNTGPAADAPEPDHRWLELWLINVATVTLAQIDPVVVGAFATTAQAGHYFAALRTAMMLSMPIVAANILVAPQIAAHYYRREPDQVQAICRYVAQIIFLPTLLGLVAIWFLAPEILSQFGKNFGEANLVLRLLTLGFAFNAFTGPCGVIMTMTGRERFFLRVLLVSLVVGISSEVVGIRLFGLWGVALGNAITQIGWNVTLWGYILVTTGIDSSALSLLRRPRFRR